MHLNGSENSEGSVRDMGDITLEWSILPEQLADDGLNKFYYFTHIFLSKGATPE